VFSPPPPPSPVVANLLPRGAGLVSVPELHTNGNGDRGAAVLVAARRRAEIADGQNRYGRRVVERCPHGAPDGHAVVRRIFVPRRTLRDGTVFTVVVLRLDDFVVSFSRRKFPPPPPPNARVTRNRITRRRRRTGFFYYYYY